LSSFLLFAGGTSSSEVSSPLLSSVELCTTLPCPLVTLLATGAGGLRGEERVARATAALCAAARFVRVVGTVAAFFAGSAALFSEAESAVSLPAPWAAGSGCLRFPRTGGEGRLTSLSLSSESDSSSSGKRGKQAS
jgi:hypothetical protein